MEEEYRPQEAEAGEAGMEEEAESSIGTPIAALEVRERPPRLLWRCAGMLTRAAAATWIAGPEWNLVGRRQEAAGCWDPHA